MGKRFGMVIWLTGLPASGKTTLAEVLTHRLKTQGHDVIALDGDEVRGIFPNTGFSREARDAHILSIGRLAAILENKGFIVICSFISPYRKIRSEVRDMCADFVEVFVDCPLDECIKRDPKGLYKKALADEIGSFTGIHDDAPYEPPINPEIHFDSRCPNAEEVIDELINCAMGGGKCLSA